MPGRPTNLKPAIRDEIYAAIADGASRDVAAACAGIGRSTLLAWIAKGRSHESGVYRDFVDGLEKAEAEAVRAKVKIITSAAEKTWQAAAWWLERRHPDEWGRRDRVPIQGLLEEEAERMARELGLDRDEILAAAERILAGSR